MAQSSIRLTLQQVRRAWLGQHHLLEPFASPRPTLARLVADVGWIPLGAPATGYLSLWARGIADARKRLDGALVGEGSELSLVPGPRGLVWIVPSQDAPVARAFAVAEHAAREARIAASMPITSRELQSVRDDIRKALDKPTSPRALRDKLSPLALRSLGTVGRRVGCETMAGLVLHALWTQGEITRLPAQGRLDDDEVQYAIDPWPKVVPNAADAVDGVARRWFRAHGPASLKAFAAAFGIALGRAQSALKPLKLQTVEIEGLGDDWRVLPDFEPPADEAPAAVSFLPFRDPLTDARQGLGGLADDAVGRAAMVKSLGPGPVVLLDGSVVGMWGYDPQAMRVVLRPFQAMAGPVLKLLEAKGDALGDFIARELRPPSLHLATKAALPPTLHAALGAEL